jgi:dihydrofolate reductase
VGAINVHEFMSLDGVIDEPTWTAEYGWDPRMGEAIGAVTARSRGILLGRLTYEMFEPAWSIRTAEDDPGAPFFNDTTKYVVSSTLETATWRNSEIVGPYDPAVVERLKDEVDGDLYVSGSGTLVRAARGRAGRRAAPVGLPAHPRGRPAALPSGSGTEHPHARDHRVVRERCHLRGLQTGFLARVA